MYFISRKQAKIVMSVNFESVKLLALSKYERQYFDLELFRVASS